MDYERWKTVKEFNMNMSQIDLRIAYAKVMTDDSKSADYKKKAHDEYNRIMDMKFSMITNVV